MVQCSIAKTLKRASVMFYQNIPYVSPSFVLTVLPANSDSDVMFVYKVIRDLESIDHVCINPIRSKGLIHR